MPGHERWRSSKGSSIRKSAGARWKGTASAGAGELVVGRGGITLPFSLRSRVGGEPATNPEELLGAAVAGCFAMSLANLCEENGHPAEHVDARATVHLIRTAEGFRIPTVELTCAPEVPGLFAEQVADLADQAHGTCPVRLLFQADVTLTMREVTA